MVLDWEEQEQTYPYIAKHHSYGYEVLLSLGAVKVGVSHNLVDVCADSL